MRKRKGGIERKVFLATGQNKSAKEIFGNSFGLDLV